MWWLGAEEATSNSLNRLWLIYATPGIYNLVRRVFLKEGAALCLYSRESTYIWSDSMCPAEISCPEQQLMEKCQLCRAGPRIFFLKKASYGKHQIEKKVNTNGKLSRINLCQSHCAHPERGIIKSITLADTGVYKYPSNFAVVVVVFVRHTTVIPFHSFIMVSVLMII